MQNTPSHRQKVAHCTLYFNRGQIIRNLPLASTISQQQTGLSNRKNVGTGMLFVFPTPTILRFWMHNTLVPLSIGFISPDGQLFQINHMQANTEVIHQSTQLSNLAIELPLHYFKQYNLAPGDKLLRIICMRNATSS